MAEVDFSFEIHQLRELPLAEAEQKKNAAYVGGQLTGKVRLKSQEDINCRGLTVELGWHTDGKGDKDRQAVVKETKDLMEIFAGQEIEMPFSLAVPEQGPISYKGKLLSITWTLRAVIDIPGRPDISAEEEITVLPAVVGD